MRWRDEPHHFNAYELEWERGSEIPLFDGADRRVITRDGGTGSATTMVRLPPGWRRSAAADDGTLECFVLEGDLSVEGERVGAGGFAAVPRGVGTVDVATESGAQLVAFWNPPLDVELYYGDGLRVARSRDVPWQSVPVGGVPHAVLYKALRVPDYSDGPTHGGPGGFLRLMVMTPGFAEPRQEIHHDCWEEILFIGGDFLMPDRGFCGPGTILSNPADFPHGPLLSQRGSLMLCQCRRAARSGLHPGRGRPRGDRPLPRGDLVDRAATDGAVVAAARGGRSGRERSRLDDLRRSGRILRLLRGHEAVAVDVVHHLLDGLARVAGDDLRHPPRHLEDLARGDLDVGRRAAEAGRALVDHDLRVREREALPGRAAARIIAAADMPIPTQIVETSGWTYCIAS